jgi:hypothetical protein
VTTVRDDRSPLAAASRLAALAENYDAVVLNVHPFDVVPSIAFSSRRPRPRVLFVNHADHVFWLGTSVADLVICFRQSGHLIARTRRGIEESRLVDLPLPLVLLQRTMSIADAKQALGIAPDHVVLLSVASEYKFESRRPPSFLDLVVPVIEQQKSTTLLAVGPTDSGLWNKANKLTAGRVRPLGVLPIPRRIATRRTSISTRHQRVDHVAARKCRPRDAVSCVRRWEGAWIAHRERPSLRRRRDPSRATSGRVPAPASSAHLRARVQSRSRCWSGFAGPRGPLGRPVAGAASEGVRAARECGSSGGTGRGHDGTYGHRCRPGIVSLATDRHGPLAVAETLGSFRGELRSLKGQALFARALLFGRALLLRSPLPVRRRGNSSIPPRWWPVSDRFLVR